MGDKGKRKVCQWKISQERKKAADFNTSKEDSVEVTQKNQWEAKPPNIN